MKSQNKRKMTRAN